MIQFTVSKNPRQHRPNGPVDAIASHASTVLAERDRTHLLRGIETAKEQSYLLWEQGYKFGITGIDGKPCDPGVVCVHRPVSVPVSPNKEGNKNSVYKQENASYYLVNLFPIFEESAKKTENIFQIHENPDSWGYVPVAVSDGTSSGTQRSWVVGEWSYTCTCKFFERTQKAFNVGVCKHGLWVLRHFQGLLARQAFVQHVLAVVPPNRPAPVTPPETIESTRRVYERQVRGNEVSSEEFLNHRKASFADALHCASITPAVPPTKDTIPCGTRSAEFHAERVPQSSMRNAFRRVPDPTGQNRHERGF